MDRTERLAAYLAGDLTADEHAALEAELAGDPGLRAELEAIRRADEALARLSTPEPPAGFESRLRDRLAPVVAAEVGQPAAAAPAHAADELAARRPRWRRLPALAAAAAAVLTLVVGGVVLSEVLPADDDAPFTTADDAMEAEPHVEDLDEPQTLEAAPPGPVIVAEDRQLDDAVIAELLAGEEIGAIAARGLDSEPGAELASRFQQELGVATAPTPEEDTPTDPGLTTRDGEQLPAPAADDVARCLEELLEPGVAAIPAYVELGRVDDTEAVLFGLVTVDPQSEAFTRAEAWVVERATCQVVHFEQD